jgi:hypothetical protein
MVNVVEDIRWYAKKVAEPEENISKTTRSIKQ